MYACSETVFNKVIRRLSPEIQPKRLNKVEVSKEMKAAIAAGMTEATKWRHDQAGTLNLATPSHASLEKELESLDSFAKKYKID